jgi:hypothetical protein
MRHVLRNAVGILKKRHRARQSSRLKEQRKDAVTRAVADFEALSIDDKEAVISRVLANHKKDFNLEKHFADADCNKDGSLTMVEFHSYITSKFLPKTMAASIGSSSLERPTARQLRLVMLASGIPFIGFGIVDNFIMLTADDLIESNLKALLPISAITAAGLGTCVSDVTGLSLGGLIEAAARRLGIQDPHLSSTQSRMPHVRFLSYISSALGISFGCLIGMFPLLFMSGQESEEAKKEAVKRRYRVRTMSSPSQDNSELSE